MHLTALEVKGVAVLYRPMLTTPHIKKHRSRIQYLQYCIRL